MKEDLHYIKREVKKMDCNAEKIGCNECVLKDSNYYPSCAHLDKGYICKNKVDKSEQKEVNKQYELNFYPGFNITCNKCNSPEVSIRNTLGWSEVSGSWGEISLVCEVCESYVIIFD